MTLEAMKMEHVIGLRLERADPRRGIPVGRQTVTDISVVSSFTFGRAG
jgi:hypothetical protein